MLPQYHSTDVHCKPVDYFVMKTLALKGLISKIIYLAEKNKLVLIRQDLLVRKHIQNPRGL